MDTTKKVIVIGLDGLEPKIVESMLKAGELPNLAKLRVQGGFGRVRTTYPAQTPVAWSTFATGTNPGGHGIYDFIARDPKTYLPMLSLNRYEQKNAFLPPQVVNGRRGTPVWELLSKAGLPSIVIRHPLTYPPDNIRGQMLAGVGVPDLRGGLGSYTLYTSAEGVKAQEGENVVQIQQGSSDITSYIIGPRDPKSRSDLKFDITWQLQPAEKRIVLRSAGQPKELEIREGEWSDWLKVKFKVGSLLSVRGMVRFYLLRFAPEFELYASPVNFDPDAPLFPISSPPEYAKELQARVGTFYTAGMAEEDAGLKNRRLGEEAFLAQCADVLREREKMMLYELERQRDGLFFILYDVTPEMKRAIHDHYSNLDAIVGKAMRYADNQTLFIVLSDHGMNSFQRGLNLNTWLYENGMLALQKGVKPGEEVGDFFRCVDWGQTKAFALGLGGIYLNAKGREQRGIITQEEAEGLKLSIAEGLAGIVDPERGRVAVKSVMTREQLYRGPYAEQAPDLLVNFAEGYRASWGTPLGGVPEGLFVDNDKKWGGDHCIDPALVPGVLFMNRPFEVEQASLVDLAPTILGALRVPKGAAMEGKSLLK